MSKNKPTALPFSLAVIAVLAATAGALYYQNRHTISHTGAISIPPIASSPTPGTFLPEALPTPGAETQAAPVVYRVVSDENGSHLKKVTLTPSQSVSASGSSPALNALNVMAASEDSPLPPGTQALSYVANADNTSATVDFNQAFVKNFPGGDTAEALAIESILATIGQFGPRSVQITVEGKKIDSLGGNQSLTEPLPVPQTATEQTAQRGSAQP
jgi:spore germination protein GerM